MAKQGMIMVVWKIKAWMALCLFSFAGSAMAMEVKHPVPKLGLWSLSFLGRGMERAARVCVGPRSQPVAAGASSGSGLPSIPGVSCGSAVRMAGDAVEVKTTCKGTLPDGLNIEIEQVARFKGDFDSKYEASSDLSVKEGVDMPMSLSTKAVASWVSDDCAGLSDGDVDIEGQVTRSVLP